jgi:hypothetical protein
MSLLLEIIKKTKQMPVIIKKIKLQKLSEGIHKLQKSRIKDHKVCILDLCL